MREVLPQSSHVALMGCQVHLVRMYCTTHEIVLQFPHLMMQYTEVCSYLPTKSRYEFLKLFTSIRIGQDGVLVFLSRSNVEDSHLVNLSAVVKDIQMTQLVYNPAIFRELFEGRTYTLPN